jgi:tetratricopeptide (TPR) repeat protein
MTRALMLSLYFAAIVVPCHRSAAQSGFDNARADIAAIWNDPIFQRQFVGAYGINAEIEPRVTPEEVELLEKVRPLMADNLPKAESTLKKQLKPDSSAMLDFTLAGIQFQQDRMEDALRNYQSCVTKFPSFRRAWRNLGLIFARDGKFDDAIAAFTRMIELGGGDAYSYGLLGFAYASKEDFQAAETAYRNALLLQPDNAEWRLGLTRAVFRQEKYQDAATLLNAMLEKYPENADFWLLQAHTFLGMKQNLKAAANLESVDALGRSTLDSLHTLGDIYVTESLFELASNAYQRAVRLESTESLARTVRSAEMLAARGAMTAASEVCVAISAADESRLNETDRRRLLKLDVRLKMTAGESSPELATTLNEIVRLDPLDGDALMLLAQYHAKNNDPEKAIFHYERAESIEAFESQACIRHAQLLVSLSRFADAAPLLRRAQEIKPRDDVARYLTQVERLARIKK